MEAGTVKKMAVILLALGMIGNASAAMKITEDGMVMGQNTDRLPPGCDSISGWKNITVHAGKEYADNFTGKMFTYSERSFSYEQCTKLTVTFVNHDEIRHQWMVHGLPTSTYRMGMFTIEVSDGPGNVTGTFILPSNSETLLVHCGVPQHMQKGMKAQLKVGGGDGKIANIPGITDAKDEYNYPSQSPVQPAIILGLLGFVFSAGALLIYDLWRSREEMEEENSEEEG
ncbi:MAG: hypothetical protein ABEK01_01455 [Candidatus Nanohaloarchaea archaeon]